MVNLLEPPDMDRVVAHVAAKNATFRARQKAEAKRVSAILKASLVPHNKTRDMVKSIRVRKRNKTDWEVVVTDPEVSFVEFGHAYRATAGGPEIKWVEGLHLVRKAAVMAGGIVEFPS